MTIKELRTLTGMTQKEFGEYLDIPMRTIQNWETGQRQCPKYLIDLINYRVKVDFYYIPLIRCRGHKIVIDIEDPWLPL